MEDNKIKPAELKVALAGLDLTEMDNYVIRFAALICKVLSIRKIIFIHVAKPQEVPDKVLSEFPGLTEAGHENLQTELAKKTKEYFKDNPDTGVHVVVENGDVNQCLLRYTKIEDLDLIFMGRKRSLKGSGIVSSRLARRSPCSLLLVPENPPEKIESIMVPVDFSGHSRYAFSYARLMASSAGASLSCANIYRVPAGYHSTGKSYDEFAKIMEGHARTDYQKFLKSMGEKEDIPCKYLLSKDGDYADLLYQQSAIEKVSLIMVGSKGRTAAAGALMGSLAEKLTYLNFTIPLLIIKKKGENMSFLEALMQL